jgi:glycosyltransferase involved in cell wall biosynthesis
MKLLFLTDNFPPEVNAPATRTYEHCREWVKDGMEVTVITCFPNFPEGKLFAGYRNKLCQVEHIDGIKVIRVFTFITANEGFVKRTLDYISFGVAAFIAGLFVKTDLIVATSPQFFAAYFARWLAFFKRKPWVMEVRDLWPESIKTVGAMQEGRVYRFLELLEMRLYRSARKIVTVTDTFKKRIIARGIDAHKIEVVKNGANLDLYTPRDKNQAIVAALGLEGKFVVSFIGTLGLAHKLSFIIEAALKINDPSIHFLIVGAGADKKNLEELLARLQPANVTLRGMIPKEMVPGYISVSDVSLINLKKSETFKTVIPSKIFESSAMGKPILLGVDGEAREIVETYPAGLYFEPENEADFLEKLYTLKADKALYNRLK